MKKKKKAYAQKKAQRSLKELNKNVHKSTKKHKLPQAEIKTQML